MKRIISILLVMSFAFSLSGCSANSQNANQTETKQKVTVNEPIDNNVNGYRVEEPKTNSDKSTMPDTITKDEISIQSKPISANNSNSAGYCGNKNSKVFHIASCGSVSKMKDENKVYSKNREEMISSGYKPCGSCKP